MVPSVYKGGNKKYILCCSCNCDCNQGLHLYNKYLELLVRINSDVRFQAVFANKATKTFAGV